MHDSENDLTDARKSEKLLEIAFGESLPDEMESAMERQYRWAEAALSQQERLPSNRRLRAAVAALGLCTVAAAGWIAFDTLWHPKTTWAEVVNSFGGVTSLAVTVFDSDHSNDPTARIDYWIGPGVRTRLHYKDWVFFGNPGTPVIIFDARSGERVEPEVLSALGKDDLDLRRALAFSRNASELGSTSLETLLTQFTEPGSVPAPELNALPVVSLDLLVFDLGSGGKDHWMRVWALRESRLPVRARSWDADDGGTTEMLFDYTSVQPAEAFDPNAYAQALRTGTGTVNRRFALLQDPAAQFVTPADVHAEIGYHVPEVVDAGCTAQGIIWIRSRNSTNQTPEGRKVNGFGKLEDEHGQEYLHRFLGHRNREDMTLECFIPMSPGAGYQRPVSITLTAWSQPDHPLQSVYEFGSQGLELSPEPRPIPDDMGNAPDVHDALRAVIFEWERQERWNKFDQLLDTIPGKPEENELALFREAMRLRKLAKMGRNEEAFALSNRLVPIVVEASTEFPWGYDDVIQTHVLQLAKRGDIQAATRLLAPYREELQTGETGTRAFYFVTGLVQALEQLGTEPALVHRIFGFNPRSIPEMVAQIKSMSSTFVPASEDPAYQPWRDYIETVAQHYKKVPLPETFDVLSDILPFPQDTPAYHVDLPDTPGYSITRFGPDWLSVARTYAYVTKSDPDRIRVTEKLLGSKVNLVVVRSDTLPQAEALRQIAKREGVVIRATRFRMDTWVARYDGRPLPNWRAVRPPDLGEDVVYRGGGTHSTAPVVLKQFERSLNGGNDGGDRVVVLDETGLPAEPGDNQTWGTICLTDHYAFGKSPAAMAAAKDWFRENFGITFAREEREVPVIEIAPMK